MRRTISISLGTLLIALFVLLGINLMLSHQSVLGADTPYPVMPLFSEEASKVFVSSFASNTDLNSGITIERATPLHPDQANYVDFAVFNHTDEPILFPDQGFGLTVFRYDAINHLWERLQLRYVPDHEPKMLPPKLETWDIERASNIWGLNENDTTTFGEDQLRLYVSGKGQITGKIYAAYLDVPISLDP